MASDRGLVTGVLRYGFAHGAVVDATTGRLLWKRRQVEPLLFSPDGSHLLAYVGRRGAILDADTGGVVALMQAPRLDLYGWTWEDDGHVLAGATFGETQAMVRLDLTGHVTRVGPVGPVQPQGATFETLP